MVWPTPEKEYNFALLGAPLDPGGHLMVQQQLKIYMQVKTKTVINADPECSGE